MCEVIRLFIHPAVLSLLLLKDVKRPSLWPMSSGKSGGQTEKTRKSKRKTVCGLESVGGDLVTPLIVSFPLSGLWCNQGGELGMLSWCHENGEFNS